MKLFVTKLRYSSKFRTDRTEKWVVFVPQSQQDLQIKFNRNNRASIMVDTGRDGCSGR